MLSKYRTKKDLLFASKMSNQISGCSLVLCTDGWTSKMPQIQQEAAFRRLEHDGRKAWTQRKTRRWWGLEVRELAWRVKPCIERDGEDVCEEGDTSTPEKDHSLMTNRDVHPPVLRFKEEKLFHAVFVSSHVVTDIWRKWGLLIYSLRSLFKPWIYTVLLENKYHYKCCHRHLALKGHCLSECLSHRDLPHKLEMWSGPVRPWNGLLRPLTGLDCSQIGVYGLSLKYRSIEQEFILHVLLLNWSKTIIKPVWTVKNL